MNSVRGPGGGYRLAKPMNELSVVAMNEVSTVDIILTVDEPIYATQCKGKDNCHNDQRCMTQNLWANLNMKIRDCLTLITLKQLRQSKGKKYSSTASSKNLRLTENSSDMKTMIGLERKMQIILYVILTKVVSIILIRNR